MLTPTTPPPCTPLHAHVQIAALKKKLSDAEAALKTAQAEIAALAKVRPYLAPI